MKKIYKYPLCITSTTIIDGPITNPLTIQKQNDRLCLWAVVDDSLPSRKIEVHCVGTGIPFPSNMDNVIYISTVQVGAGVFHYFFKYL